MILRTIIETVRYLNDNGDALLQLILLWNHSTPLQKPKVTDWHYHRRATYKPRWLLFIALWPLANAQHNEATMTIGCNGDGESFDGLVSVTIFVSSSITESSASLLNATMALHGYCIEGYRRASPTS